MRPAPLALVHAAALVVAAAVLLADVTPAAGQAIAGTSAVAAAAADASGTRLFFGPTARALPAGTAYVGLYGATLPFVQYGITDRLSIGGGTPLLFGVGQVFWLTPKLQVYRGDGLQGAVGLVHVAATGANVGLAYGVATMGSDAQAVTIGAGWAYSGSGTEHGGAPVLTIAADRRANAHLRLMTENYVNREVAFVSGGVRLGSRRFHADLALLGPLTRQGVFLAPLVTLSWIVAGDR